MITRRLPILSDLDAMLRGQGDAALRTLLVVAAGVLLWTAFQAPTAWKAAVLGWIIFP